MTFSLDHQMDFPSSEFRRGFIAGSQKDIACGVGMSFQDFIGNPLWPVLVETVHAMVMYPHHKAYTRDVVFHEQPDITSQDLATKLGMPLGEAFVILQELKRTQSEGK